MSSQPEPDPRSSYFMFQVTLLFLVCMLEPIMLIVADDMLNAA